MSKSPYELRTELLTIAMNVLKAQHNAEHSRQLQEVLKRVDGPLPDPGVPTAPTTDEIIAEAKKLYEFIQTQ